MGSILTLAMLVYFVSVFIHPSTFITSMFYDSAMALSFLCLLWITRIIQRDEKESAIKVLKGLFGRKNIGTLQV